jgi:TolA-binding protein
MLSNKHHNDKVLKVFSSIRCLNKDQLPRYIGGRLTDIEKHLVEQHLADCDLCYGALQALEKEDGQEKYQDLTYKLQRYVRDSIQPVSHVQKVAQYTRKEKTKEYLLFYFWVFAFIGLGVGSVYVLKGHIRNQPPPPIRYVAAVTPAPQETRSVDNTPPPATNTQVVAPVNTPQTSTQNPVQLPQTAATTPAPAPAPTPAAVAPAVDSAAIKKAAALRAQQRKAAADSIARVKQAQLLQKQQDSIRNANEKAKEAESRKAEEEKKPAPKQEQQTAIKETTPAPEKKETPPPTATDSDEYLYKAAMAFQQQGNYNEAINRYKKLESVSSGRYVELARYQMAVCYKNKGQSGKARRMFKEVVRMDGSMKNSAQQALENM